MSTRPGVVSVSPSAAMLEMRKGRENWEKAGANALRRLDMVGSDVAGDSHAACSLHVDFQCVWSFTFNSRVRFRSVQILPRDHQFKKNEWIDDLMTAGDTLHCTQRVTPALGRRTQSEKLDVHKASQRLRGKSVSFSSLLRFLATATALRYARNIKLRIIRSLYELLHRAG